MPDKSVEKEIYLDLNTLVDVDNYVEPTGLSMVDTTNESVENLNETSDWLTETANDDGDELEE